MGHKGPIPGTEKKRQRGSDMIVGAVGLGLLAAFLVFIGFMIATPVGYDIRHESFWHSRGEILRGTQAATRSIPGCIILGCGILSVGIAFIIGGLGVIANHLLDIKKLLNHER